MDKSQYNRQVLENFVRYLNGRSLEIDLSQVIDDFLKEDLTDGSGGDRLKQIEISDSIYFKAFNLMFKGYPKGVKLSREDITIWWLRRPFIEGFIDLDKERLIEYVKSEGRYLYQDN